MKERTMENAMHNPIITNELTDIFFKSIPPLGIFVPSASE